MKSKFIKNKKFIMFLTGILVVLLIAISYFGYKGYLLHKYDVSNITDFPLLSDEMISISSNSKNSKSNEEYEKVKYVVPNKFKLFDDNEDLPFKVYDYEQYILNYKSEEVWDAKIIVSKDTNLYNLITKEEKEPFDGIDRVTAKNILNNHKIYNYKDLYETWIKNQKRDINIFTKTSKIKYNYIITSSSIVATQYKIVKIKGDYDGYLYVVGNNAYQASIFIDDDVYNFVFVNRNKNYFNLDNVKSFLSNVDYD